MNNFSLKKIFFDVRLEKKHPKTIHFRKQKNFDANDRKKIQNPDRFENRKCCLGIREFGLDETHFRNRTFWEKNKIQNSG